MKLTDDQIAKLPKFAQAAFKDLELERFVAVRALREWTDSQTVSPVSIEEIVCDGEQQSPSFKKRYIQTNRVKFEWMGVELEVYLKDDQSQGNAPGISLQWNAIARGVL